jgi:hypothetical protein
MHDPFIDGRYYDDSSNDEYEYIPTKIIVMNGFKHD